MKLASLKIDSFGGITNTEISFDSRFTVIEGPNEAGKSTIYNTLWNLLLTDVSLTKSVFKKSMERFLPLAGGDTIGAELAFIHNGESYRLHKRWGKTPSIQFILPDGALLTGEEEVKQRMTEILPAGVGTVRDIFLTRQSSLGETVQHLTGSRETLFSLSDLLKKAVLETGGVSLSRFNEHLEALHEEYFKKWDRLRQFPEKGRGISNPYKTGLGQILSSYYEVENLKGLLEDGEKIESEYEECEKEHQALDDQRSEIEQLLAEQAVLYQQARDSVRIEGELTKVAARADLLKTDQERWPVADAELQQHRKRQADLRQTLVELKSEQARAEHIENHRELKGKYTRALKKREALQDKQKNLAELKPIETALLGEMRSLTADLNRLEGILSSGSIRVNIKAKNETAFSVSVGDDSAEEKISLNAEESREVTGAGKITLESVDWKMDISTGDEEIQRAGEEYKKKKKRSVEILSNTGARDLETLEQLSADYEKAAQEVKSSEENLENELEGISFEALSEEVAADGLDEPARPLQTIAKEVGSLEKDGETLSEKMSSLEKELLDLKEKYSDKETLFASMIEAHSKKKELEDALIGAESLPEGIVNYSAFIQHYESMLKKREELKDILAEMGRKKAELEGKLPDESTVEIQVRLEDARAAFEGNVTRGEALIKIREAADRILEQEDEGGDASFKEEFLVFLQSMTSGKYSDVVMDEYLPVEIGRKDGRSVPRDYLSEGTKDSFALALKLAMVKTFLQGAEGFFVLDDPMVDMDPQRRKNAAKAINSCAGDIQIILFTCHPSHAALFEGAERFQLKE